MRHIGQRRQIKRGRRSRAIYFFYKEGRAWERGYMYFVNAYFRRAAKTKCATLRPHYNGDLRAALREFNETGNW